MAEPIAHEDANRWQSHHRAPLLCWGLVLMGALYVCVPLTTTPLGILGIPALFDATAGFGSWVTPIHWCSA